MRRTPKLFNAPTVASTIKGGPDTYAKEPERVGTLLANTSFEIYGASIY